MRKEISLEVVIPATGPAAGSDPLAGFVAAFAAANPNLHLTVAHWAPGPGPDEIDAFVVVRGEQPAARDFAALVQGALERAGAPPPGARELAAPIQVTEAEHADEDTGAVLAPPRPPLPEAATRELEAPLPIPPDLPRPPPPPTTFVGCPAPGTGGDPMLNVRKNRTDQAPWTPVALASVLALPYPSGIARRDRAVWPLEASAAVAAWEGMPLQVEGWLAGAHPEGGESCNCYDADHVDWHLWLVDDPSKVRADSLVCEVTPRVRNQNRAWTFARVAAAVTNGWKVRIGGWLLLDQEHPEQIGRYRATLWEIHPICTFDVQRADGTWIPLSRVRVPTRGATPAPLAG